MQVCDEFMSSCHFEISVFFANNLTAALAKISKISFTLNLKIGHWTLEIDLMRQMPHALFKLWNFIQSIPEVLWPIFQLKVKEILEFLAAIAAL